MEKSLDQYFTAILGVEDSNPAEYSGLALAYIGDSVFDLLVKTVLVSKDNKQARSYSYRKCRVTGRLYRSVGRETDRAGNGDI